MLEGKDVLALLPTGGGKSLCYQVPSVIMPGFCLVVTPLIALMQDQVKRLNGLGIAAACIHAGMPFAEVDRTLKNMIHGPFKLLYISPERIQSALFREYLPDMEISFLAVDEAHCISQWGHDFRPDYLRISWLRVVFPEIPVLAVTATATGEIQKDIVQYLELRNPVRFQASFRRPNIHYDIRYSENKMGDTQLALSRIKGSSIIYCRSRKQTEVVARALNNAGFQAAAYHAGLDRDKRDAAQQAWMENRVTIMVATTAFGMGIDKADVRLVLHYDAPENLESFYQESGRAGRDGAEAQSICLYSHSDITRLEESGDLLFPTEAYLRKVYQSVAEYLQVPVSAEPDKYYPFDLGEFASRFRLQALPASNALRLLEKEGLWTLSESVFSPATIQIIASREELDEVSRRYPDLGLIIITLLRMYGTLFYYPTPVRASAIAAQMKLPRETAELLLLQLESMELISYERPREGSHLYFHHLRVDSSHLLLDLERIHRLRTSHQKKTDAMLAFLAETNECREQRLLRYFEEGPGERCGHCDNCIRHQQKSKPVSNARETLLEMLRHRPLALATLSENMPQLTKDQIVHMLRMMIDEGKVLRNASGEFYLSSNE